MDERLYETFADVSEDHWWFEARRQILGTVLAQALAADPTMPAVRDRTILDVGCGTGGMFDALSPLGAVTGIDMSPEVVEFCRQHFAGTVSVEQGRVPEDLPQDGTYDVVGAFDVIEHIDDDVTTLRRMRDAVRPGGIVFVAVPAFQILWGPTDVLSHHFRRYRAPQLRRSLTASGLEIVRTSYFNTWLFPPVAAVRIGRRAFAPRDRDPVPDLEMTSPRVDKLLTRLFASERHILRRYSLPFGVSLLAVARRPLSSVAGPS